jgi:hypothetical protein
MGRVVSAALNWHPLIVLIAYGILVSSYRHHLDGNLKYIRPPIPAAPEDVLGFGFWVPWFIVAAWFLIACILSYQFGLQRRTSYWSLLLSAFGLLSVLDFYLYGALERQVLSG